MNTTNTPQIETLDVEALGAVVGGAEITLHTWRTPEPSEGNCRFGIEVNRTSGSVAHLCMTLGLDGVAE